MRITFGGLIMAGETRLGTVQGIVFQPQTFALTHILVGRGPLRRTVSVPFSAVLPSTSNATEAQPLMVSLVNGAAAGLRPYHKGNVYSGEMPLPLTRRTPEYASATTLSPSAPQGEEQPSDTLTRREDTASALDSDRTVYGATGGTLNVVVTDTVLQANSIVRDVGHDALGQLSAITTTTSHDAVPLLDTIVVAGTRRWPQPLNVPRRFIAKVAEKTITLTSTREKLKPVG